MDGRRAGRDARPGGAQGRRLRLCAGLDLEYRKAAAGGAAAHRADRPQQRRRVHPGGAHRRHAAAPGRSIRLRRQAPHLPRHPAGLLGRRQPVSPPSGSEPAAPRLRAPGYGDRARIGVDRERAPRRHRLAGDDHAGARGYRRLGGRPADGGDAPGGRALPRGARRLRDLHRPRRASRLWRQVHRGKISPAVARTDLRADPPRLGGARRQRARFQ